MYSGEPSTVLPLNPNFEARKISERLPVRANLVVR
jgi:hypothetical protein